MTKKPNEGWIAAGSIGIEFAACTVIGLLVGAKLDHWLGLVNPYCTLFGLLLGLAAGIKGLLRVARKSHHDEEKPDDPRNQSGAA
jgi:F0F1-type ATP synthase assembly protein I